MNKLFVVGGVLAPLLTEASEKPNIIYIMTDQQTATAMSCMGNKDLHTPNLDRLADAGVIFRNAYCSAPLSGPSRASMFTGHFSHEIGMPSNNMPMPEELKSQSLGVLMQNSGYDCVYAGKWHVHTPSIPDKEFGFRNIYHHNDIGLAESCADYLNSRQKVPFFLVASFDNPHNICEYARHQNMPFAEVPQNALVDCPGLPMNYERNPYDADVLTYEKSLNYSAYPTVDYTPNDWRQYRDTYYRLVEHVDAEIGKIVDAIDRNNLWKNTVVIFTSDHGDGVGAHKWNQKSALYEEVINVPMIVVLPGKKNAGKTLPQLINNGVDFFASVCDWANIKLPENVTGISYKSLVEKCDDKANHQDYIVTETLFDKGGGTRGWAVRTQHYKYVIYDKGRYREQLFDMDSDCGEMRNLAVEKKFEKVLSDHRALLDQWMKQHKTKQIRQDVRIIPGL